METFNDTGNRDFNREPLPSGLHALTILTFIGSGIALLSSVWNFLKAKQNFDTREDTLEKMSNPNAPKWAKSLMPDPAHFNDMMTKAYENRLPIFILSLISLGLCIAGAAQMRQRKKQGYLLYVIGEILPLLTPALFIGTYILTTSSYIFFLVICVLFIILYTGQRKYLTA